MTHQARADESHSHTVMDSLTAPLHCYTVTLPQVVNKQQGGLIRKADKVALLPLATCDSSNNTQQGHNTVTLPQIVNKQQGGLIRKADKVALLPLAICDSPNSTQQTHTTQHWRPRHNDTDHVSSDTSHSDTPEHSQTAEDASDASSSSDDLDPTAPERLRSVVSLYNSSNVPLTSKTELGVINSVARAPVKHRDPIPTITCMSCHSSSRHRIQRHRPCTYTDRHGHLQVIKRRGCKKHAFWARVLNGGQYKLVSGSPGTLETMGTPAFLMTECPCTFKL